MKTTIIITALLLLVLSHTAYSQGEYFKEGTTGFTIGRFFSRGHDLKANSTALGFSYYGRLDIAMTRDFRYSMFDNRNSYSFTAHLFKQGFTEKDDFPFSFAVSIIQSKANIRTYSFIPYRLFELHPTIDLIVHAGFAYSRQIRELFSPELNSFPIGFSLMGNFVKNLSVGAECGASFSKAYPGFGAGLVGTVSF